ncbi:MAG: ParB/RepB/Spo0J family partition protein [Rubrivivax sp.]
MTTEPLAAEFKTLALPLIARSLTNPRKHFDAAKLQDLANSIASSGVHQPILVRPLPGHRQADTFESRQPGEPLPEFELIAGERRYRASQLAGLQTIPAIVRHLDDAQVIEVQILENLQRDDLTPMEEAEGYEQLCTVTGITREQLATRIGKSRTYVFNRLKLLDLCQEAKAALREGQLDASRAELIARIPDQKLQLKALKALTEKWNDELRLSYRQAKLWLEQNVMLRLERAVFDIKDAKLCGDKPACTDCVQRTGANPDLFSDIDSPDVCTNPPCFHEKEQAHHELVVAKARKTGIPVIEGEEAEKIMPSRHWIEGHCKVDKELVDPRTGEQKPRHMLLEEFFDKAKIKAATRLIICPHTHQAIKVVTEELDEDLDTLLDQAAAKSKTTPKEVKAAAKERLQEEEDRKRAELTLKYEKEWRGRALHVLKPLLLSGAVSAFTPEVLRDLLKTLVENSRYEFDEFLPDVLDLNADSELDEEQAMKAIDALPDDQLGARICLLLATRDATLLQVWAPNPKGTGQMRVPSPTTSLVSLAISANMNPALIQADVQQEMREELGVQTKAKGKKAAPPDDPAAQPAASPPAAAETKAKKKPGAKAQKISAEEAQRGIAAAIQSYESGASSGAPEGVQQSGATEEA